MHFRKVEKHYDQLAQFGPYGTLAPHNRGGQKAQYVAAVFDAALIPALLNAGQFKALLDFGCGTGIFLHKSAMIGDFLVGIDLSSGILETARNFCAGISNIIFAKVDGMRLPFDAHSFDRVIARESLCYVPDEKLIEVLAEIYRVLTPGGIFLLLDQISVSPKWRQHPDAPNLTKRPSNVIQRALSTAGFHVEEERVVRAPRFPWIYLIWIGFISSRYISRLARAEVAWHRRTSLMSGRRWHNSLFIARKPVNE